MASYAVKPASGSTKQFARPSHSYFGCLIENLNCGHEVRRRDMIARMGVLGALTAAVLALPACGGTGSVLSAPQMESDAIVIQVPASVASVNRPAVYFRDPANRNQLLAYSWSGQLVGKLLLEADQPTGVEQSPDGTRLLITGATLKSGGTLIAKAPDGQWADDSNHLCLFADAEGRTSGFNQLGALSGSPTPAWLYEATVPPQSPGSPSSASLGMHGGPVLLACSAKQDRAVVAEEFVAQMSGLQAMALSNGAVAYRLQPGSQAPPFDAVASSDGRYIAVGNTLRMWSGSGNLFAVVDTMSGKSVATVKGSGIVAFSSDDSRVITIQYLGGSSSTGTYRLIDWRSGAVLWTATGGPGTVRTLPGSGDFMVGLRHYVPSPDRENGLDPREEVIVVHKDGSSATILHDAFPIE